MHEIGRVVWSPSGRRGEIVRIQNDERGHFIWVRFDSDDEFDYAFRPDLLSLEPPISPAS